MRKSFSPIELLEDRGEFSNQHGVSIMLMDEHGVHVACDYPDTPCPDGYSLEIVKMYETEEAFLSGMRIASKIALNAVTPQDMLRKYEEGDMDLRCSVGKGRIAGVLVFHKCREVLLATNEDSGQHHQVDQDMHDGADYIAYTVAHFHL